MLKVLTFAAGLLALTFAAQAANTERMAALTQEMISRAIEHYAKVGRGQAEIDFNKKSEDWYREEYYLHMFGMSADGIVWADNVWPEFIGTDFTLAADFRGVEFGKEIVANTPNDGSIYRVELQFMNPDTGDLSPSIGACARVDAENILCSWTNG